MSYASSIRVILSPSERRLFQRLSTPARIQDYLDGIVINFELQGDTDISPRAVVRERRAHCAEGAIFAAAVLAYHGHKPLLMDFRTSPTDEDHVVAIFRQNGRWGAISKTNHAILRYRDAVYLSPRELAMSYFNEYLERDGRKSMRAYSAPFDISRYAPERWVTAEGGLEWLVEALDSSKHFPVASKKYLRSLRRADDIELRAMKITEWDKRGLLRSTEDS